MNETSNPNDELQIERIDADAVCEACGTVNPEDTLLCKTCGNNLRDQRSRRLGGSYDLEGLPAERRPMVGLRIGLVTLGILLFVAVAVNLGNIEDLMLRAQTAESGNLKRFWSGFSANRYVEMVKVIHTSPVSNADVAKAIAQPIRGETLDGRYVLMPQGADPKAIPYGEAVVKTEGETVYFVVVLDDPAVEIRGEAQKETENRITCREDASFQAERQYFQASGFAVRLDTGAFACYAMTDLNDDRYGVAAYRLP